MGYLVLTLLGAPRRTFAQVDDYRELTEAAVEEYRLGHWDEALALFTKAHERQPSARTFWGLGIASFEARRYADALRFSQAALHDPRKPLTDTQRAQAENVVRRSKDFLVRLKLVVVPSDASVSIDGNAAEHDSQGLVLLGAGAHQLVVNADGYEQAVRSVEWAAGSSATLTITLHPADGREPSTATPSTPRDKRALALRIAKWSALGLSVASLGVLAAGIAERQQAAKHWNDEARCPVDKALSCGSVRDKANHWRSANVATGVAAAAFGALAVTLFVLDRPRAHAIERALSTCQPGFAALSCRLTF